MARPELKWFYNSGEWKAARYQALKRDHFTCQICGARATEVHHLIELNEMNVRDQSISLNLNNLQGLCHACHTALTTREHRGSEPDSGLDYYFDESGMLQRYPTPPGGR